MSFNGDRVAGRMAVFVVLLTLSKVISVVFFGDFMGYANNYDFIRQSSCVGVWQNYQNKARSAANPDAPVNSLIYDGVKDERLCMNSIDNVFPVASTVFHEVGDPVDFREVSVWKIFVLVVFLAILFFSFEAGVGRLVLSLLFFLVFGDLANLLYMNTLYFEYSVIFSLFFLVFSVSYLICGVERSRGFYAVGILSIIWLGLSKQQYMPLASLIGLFCSLSLFLMKRKRIFAAAFALISLCVPFVYGHINSEDSEYMKSVNFANKTDTFLTAVLPAAGDKAKALHTLGLPQDCLRGVGMSWYTPNIQQNHPCPEVEYVSRIKLLGLFVEDSSTFLEPLRRTLIGMHPFFPNHLGHIEVGGSAESKKYIWQKESSLSALLAKLPPSWLPTLFVGSIIVAAIAFFLVFFSIFRGSCRSPFAVMLVLGGLIVVYSVSSSVFGDGYADVQKHAVGFLIGVSFQMVGLAAAIFELIWRISNGRRVRSVRTSCV